MNRAIEIWNSSILGRVLTAICLWFSGQWQRSRVVRAFVAPMAGRQAAESSVFFRLWDLIRGGLCALYRRLGLERLFGGSIFLCLTLWCSAAVVLAPLLPTMAVLALAAVAFASLALNLVRDRARPLAYSPVNRYILLYAAVYLAATATSVTPRQSLFPGLLMVFFMVFALVVENAVDSWERAEQLVFLMVLAGGVVALLGVGQYVLGATGDAAWVDSDMFSSIEFRVPSTLENPNMLGQYLILAIPLGGARLLSAKSWPRRIFYLACCAVMCVCMLLTFSRGAWLGLLFAGLVFVVLWNPRLILLAPVALVLQRSFGIKLGNMVTIHSYTNDQRILDMAHKDLRRARAAACSIIPTSTGAAQAVAKVIPELKGKFSGYSLRVPTPTVSVVDFSGILEKETDTEGLLAALRQAAETDLKGILEYNEKPLVSMDFKGNPASSILESSYTTVQEGHLVKAVAWYDNEWGYSNRVCDLICLMADKGL